MPTETHSPGSDRERLFRWLAVALAATIALWVSWRLADRPHSDRAEIACGFQAALGFVAVGAALIASGRCRGRARTAWRLLALAFTLHLTGLLVQIAAQLQGNFGFPAVANALYLAFYLPMFAGLLRFPSDRWPAAERIRFSLDLATVALAAALLVGHVVPTHVRDDGFHTLADAATLAYPVGDMIVLAGITTLLLRRTLVARAASLRLLGGGTVCFTTAALIVVTQGSSYRFGDWVDLLFLLATALFALAGAREPGSPTRAPLSEAYRPAVSAIPYLAIVVALGLLLFDHASPVLLALTIVLGLCVCARQALVSSDLLRLERAASHQSRHDSVTGLPNRRELINDLERAFATTDTTTGWTFVMSDLDGFKAYNDTFGHHAGDKLLAQLGDRLQRALPTGARAYRLGGDEFCVLVADDELDPDAVGALTSQTLSDSGSGFHVGASVGIVRLPSEAPDPTSALQLADGRMYVHKESRRMESVMGQMRDVLLAALSEQGLDERTENLPDHMLDVGQLAGGVAQRMGLKPAEAELTQRAGELHDVGKIAVPVSILAKPGPLDADEWQCLRRHTVIGERVLDAAPTLAPIARLVRSTHERFDGRGYPDGLSGDQIPLPARIVFACDAYSAMVADRSYAPAAADADARAELRRCAGSQFDPAVVTALLAELDAIAGPARPPLASSVRR